MGETVEPAARAPSGADRLDRAPARGVVPHALSQSGEGVLRIHHEPRLGGLTLVPAMASLLPPGVRAGLRANRGGGLDGAGARAHPASGRRAKPSGAARCPRRLDWTRRLPAPPLPLPPRSPS